MSLHLPLGEHTFIVSSRDDMVFSGLPAGPDEADMLDTERVGCPVKRK